jgi:wobble nucleotide-excising tRNase
MQNVIAHSQKKSEKLKTVVGDHQELAALERRIADDEAKICSLEKANSKLRGQLEVQGKAHQEQLREQEKPHREQLQDQRKAHQGKPLLPSSTCIYQFVLDSEKALHHRT